MTAEIGTQNLPAGYSEWRRKIVTLIENAKLSAAIHVNTDMLSLYWSIGSDIIRKKKELGWGAQIIEQLSLDLTRKFPEDKGYSVRNLHYMRRFAENYPNFPILQASLAELSIDKGNVAILYRSKDGITTYSYCRKSKIM